MSLASSLTRFLTCFSLLAFFAPFAFGGTLIDISVRADQTLPNDLAKVTVFSEASGATGKQAASKVNPVMAEAENLVKTYENIKYQSGRISVSPDYDYSSVKRPKIISWSMHSELLLESRDIPALSELLGKLQDKQLGVSNLRFFPSPENTKTAVDQATREAIAEFQSRAQKIAQTLGAKSYQIKQMKIIENCPLCNDIMPKVMYAAARSSESAPMPMTAGETQVFVVIDGQIELPDIKPQ